MNKIKSKFSKKYNLSEQLIIFSGRKCRQKARKLAKQNSQTQIVVISKKGNPIYWVFFDEYSNLFYNTVFEIEILLMSAITTKD
jgi:hypothetical protein